MQAIVLLFGFISVSRILKSFERKNYFSEKQLTKIGTLSFLLVALTIFSLKRSLFFCVLAVGFELLLLLYFPLLSVVIAENKVLTSVPETLRMITLNMRLGKSFRSAFHEVITHQSSQQIQNQMLKAFKVVTFPQQKQKVFYFSELNNLVYDLQYVDQLDAGAVDCLKHLSTYYKMKSDFRRKSGKIKGQIRLQALLLSVMLLATMVFMIITFGFDNVLGYLVCSLCLACTGHFIAFRMGTKIKWRI